MSTSKIHSDIVALRRKVGGLKAEQKAGVRYKVKNAATLMAKLREALDELNMVCYPVQHDVQTLQVAEGSNCSCKITLYIGSDDGSGILATGIGRGADTADKAEGKASTYAWKDCLVKALNLPDADMPDTDDEDLSGSPAVRAAKPGTSGGAAADFEAEVAAAKTRADLDGIAARAKDAGLPTAVAIRLVGAINAKKAEIG